MEIPKLCREVRDTLVYTGIDRWIEKYNNIKNY